MITLSIWPCSSQEYTRPSAYFWFQNNCSQYESGEWRAEQSMCTDGWRSRNVQPVIGQTARCLGEWVAAGEERDRERRESHWPTFCLVEHCVRWTNTYRWKWICFPHNAGLLCMCVRRRHSNIFWDFKCLIFKFFLNDWQSMRNSH